MTDYSKWNEFIKFSNKPKEINDRKSKSIAKTFQNIESHYNIKPGDMINLLYMDSNEEVVVIVEDNHYNYEPRFSDNPKSNITKATYTKIPARAVKTDSLSTLTELYNLLKDKKEGDIVTLNNKRIKILEILKKDQL